MKIEKKESGCCGSSCGCREAAKRYELVELTKPYVIGSLDTKIGRIAQVSAALSVLDKWENIKVRCAIGRMRYSVAPGLYAVGSPSAESVVFVTANYKLSFDHVRQSLNGLHAWILVLDTKGINVWCAAGKGTFSTSELVHRIAVSGLKEVVTHRRLIVPQLGAVGVSAHQVKKKSGFAITYGPVRASDIPAFIQADMKATPEMRQVQFQLKDRLKVIPVELVMGFRTLIKMMVVFFLIAAFTAGGHVFQWQAGMLPLFYLLVAYLAGVVVGPLLLPWLPSRSFAVKGAFAGLMAFVVAYFTVLTRSQTVEIMAWLLLITSLSSFLTLNFTGASTYTSLSGVKKEMRFAIPTLSIGAGLGLLLWLGVRIKLF